MRSDDVFSAPATPELATVTEAEFMEVAEAPDEPCLLGVVGEAMPSENESWSTGVDESFQYLVIFN